MSTPADRLKMAASIISFEARRDAQGRLKVYKLPIDDGGGTYEVAGINDRYHPQEARHLADLIEAGRFQEAEEQAQEIIATYTDGAATWTSVTAIECYLRDCYFNRGPRGAARILQRAVGVMDDGVVGAQTRAAISSLEGNPASVLDKLRQARERYERDVVHRDESSKFWKGLVNRWNNALSVAKSFLGAPAPAAPAAFAVASTEGAGFDAALAAVTNALGGGAASPAGALLPGAGSSVLGPLGGAILGPVGGAILGPVGGAILGPLLDAVTSGLAPASTSPMALPALRLGARGPLVRAWQSFLLGKGLDPGGLDGEFGDKTAAATKAFQASHGLTSDGIAGRETLLKAMQLGFELIEEPAADTTGSNFPPRPNFAPLANRPAVFGSFNFVPAPQPGNREAIRILGTWEQDNIISVPIPQLRKALGPGAPASMRFHRLAAEQLKGLWQDWDQANLLNRVLSYDGAFVARFIRGSNSVLSNHAFGSAFDINAGQNGLGARPALVGQTGSVRELVPLAHKWGFFWGGHFGSRPDGMHFEIAFLK